MHQLYVITKDLPLNDQKEKLKIILNSGIDWLQYRRKAGSLQEKIHEINWLKEQCNKTQTRLIINDNLPLAKATSVSSVHLGQEDLKGLPPSSIKDHCPWIDFLGITAKTVGQAQKAKLYGADYLGVGALYPSATKPQAVALSLDSLKAIYEASDLPLYLIGGISPQGITPQLKAYAKGFVVCDYLYSHPSTLEALENLKESLGFSLDSQNMI